MGAENAPCVGGGYVGISLQIFYWMYTVIVNLKFFVIGTVAQGVLFSSKEAGFAYRCL